MKKQLLLALIICSMTMVLSSCSPNYTFYKAHKLDNVSPNDVAYVLDYNYGESLFDDPYPDLYGVILKIFAVDGEHVPGVSLGFTRVRNRISVEVLPGEHVLTVWFHATKPMMGGYYRYKSEDPTPFRVKVEAGHTYQLAPVVEKKEEGKLFWSPSIRDITGQEGDPRLWQKK